MGTPTVCAHTPDPLVRLAVLGVFSVDGHAATREAIRESWLGAREPTDESIVVRFVLRARSAARVVVEEAATYSDVTFVDAELGDVKLNEFREKFEALDPAEYPYPKGDKEIAEVWRQLQLLPRGPQQS